MTLLHDILKHNETFVDEKQYEQYATSKFPNKKIVVLTCMDTRLIELLPKAMNFKNGDAKIVKSAGAIINHPFGGIMRSILVAIYELQADEIFVVGHHDCGMSSIDPEKMMDKMKERGITEETFSTLSNAAIDLKEYLRGFDNVEESVRHSVEMLKNHPLMDKKVPVHGLVIDPSTGKLTVVEDGYSTK